MKQSAALYAYKLLTRALPPTKAFELKNFLLRKCGVQVGKNVRCVSSATFSLTGKLKIGDGSFIGHGVSIIGGDADVVIGRNVDIAPGVLIVTGSHEITPLADRVAGPGFSSEIIISDGCWIGAGAIILGGTVLSKNTIVAAGAVVNGAHPSHCIIAGIPAKVIRKLQP